MRLSTEHNEEKDAMLSVINRQHRIWITNTELISFEFGSSSAKDFKTDIAKAWISAEHLARDKVFCIEFAGLMLPKMEHKTDSCLYLFDNEAKLLHRSVRDKSLFKHLHFYVSLSCAQKVAVNHLERSENKSSTTLWLVSRKVLFDWLNFNIKSTELLLNFLVIERINTFVIASNEGKLTAILSLIHLLFDSLKFLFAPLATWIEFMSLIIAWSSNRSDDGLLHKESGLRPTTQDNNPSRTTR